MVQALIVYLWVELQVVLRAWDEEAKATALELVQQQISIPHIWCHDKAFFVPSLELVLWPLSQLCRNFIWERTATNLMENSVEGL
jgi:hypothetical protein